MITGKLIQKLDLKYKNKFDYCIHDNEGITFVIEKDGQIEKKYTPLSIRKFLKSLEQTKISFFKENTIFKIYSYTDRFINEYSAGFRLTINGEDFRNKVEKIYRKKISQLQQMQNNYIIESSL